jgi:4-hydroxybenzoate polyprenyltransferase
MPQLLREEVRKAPPIPVVQGRSQAVSLLRLLRPHQWVKNILVLIPMLLAHEWNQFWVVRNAILATICFCVTASAVYISNDLLDIEADRNHASKKHRPLASNAVTPATAIVLMFLLLALAVALAIRLPLGFGISLLVYFVVSSLYSVYLKTKVILDICVLAGLYTIRLFAGGAATYIPISEWTLAFAMFCFLGLAAVKRYTELQSLAQDPKALLRRGYEQTDQLTVHVLGMTSMMLSVLVLALYLHAPEVARLYRHPEWLWLMCPVLLYWFGRIWVAAGRGRMHSDPIVFALRDRVSLMAAGVIVAIGLLCK